MIVSDNKIVCDLKKVQWAQLVWKNQWGQTCRELEPGNSVRGILFKDDEKVFGSEETMLAYAARTGLLDIWTPCVRLQFASNHRLTYVGDKAKAIYDAWCAMIFSKKKGKK